jgi:hypothetical protein
MLTQDRIILVGTAGARPIRLNPNKGGFDMKFNKKQIAIVLLAVMISLVAGMAAAMVAETIVGTVEATDAGLMLKAGDGDYMLTGEDMSAMIGKMVTVTGSFAESESGTTLHVMSFEEM